MNKTSKLPVLVTMAAALVGLVIYLVTSFTGYLANAAVDPKPIIFTIVAVAALAVLLWKGDSLMPILGDGLLLLAGLFLIASFAAFVLGRVTLAADVYFIPVNYPAAEETALIISFVGLGCYLVGIIAAVCACFAKKDK